MYTGDKRMGIKKKELELALDHLNTMRAFFCALIFSILLPVFVLVIHFSGIYGAESGWIKTFLAICEAYQLVMLLFGYFCLINNEMDKFKLYYRSYFLISMSCILVIGYVDYSNTSSILMFIIASVFIGLVPIFQVKERKIFIGILIFGMIFSSVMGQAISRELVDIIVMSIIMTIAAYMVQDYMIEHEKLSIRLKAKTLTSELDPLTGLANRRGLDRKASVLWPYSARTATPLGLIEIDIDFFKKYNDKFGHPAGDRCLKMIGSAIKKAAKRGSDITARTGGEEFLVFVQGMNEQEMVALAMKIRRTIEELRIPHGYVNISNYVTVSMGVATIIPDDNNSFQDLYEEADISLYNAKKYGRNCVVCRNKIYGRMKKGLATVISG